MGLQSQVCMSYPLNYREGTGFKKMQSRISMAGQGYEKRIKYTVVSSGQDQSVGESTPPDPGISGRRRISEKSGGSQELC